MICGIEIKSNEAILVLCDIIENEVMVCDNEFKKIDLGGNEQEIYKSFYKEMENIMPRTKTKNAPEYLNGLRKTFEEVFVSPFEKENEADALRVLLAIRAAHPEQYGWYEIDGYVEQLPNGKWRAVRHHAQYK